MSRKVINVVAIKENNVKDTLIFRQDGSFVGELTEEQIENLIGMSIAEFYSNIDNYRFTLLSSPQDSDICAYAPGLIIINKDENNIIIQCFNFISTQPGSLSFANQAFIIILSSQGEFVSATVEALS